MMENKSLIIILTMMLEHWKNKMKKMVIMNFDYDKNMKEIQQDNNGDFHVLDDHDHCDKVHFHILK